MDASQRRNELPLFGLPAVTPETAGYKIIRGLNIQTLNIKTLKQLRFLNIKTSFC